MPILNMAQRIKILAVAATNLNNNDCIMVVKNIGSINGTGSSDDSKVSADAKNTAHTKTNHKEKEWSHTFSVGCILSWFYLCPIVAVKSLDSSVKDNTCVELNSHADNCWWPSDGGQTSIAFWLIHFDLFHQKYIVTSSAEPSYEYVS